MKPKMSSRLQQAALAFPVFLCPSLAMGITVVNDTFELDVHPSSFRTVPAGTGIPFYSSRTTDSTPIQILDDATFGSKALTVLSVSQQVAAPLPGTIFLTNPGDTLTLSFKVRITNYDAATGGSAAFRFGLHDAGAMIVSGDNFGTGSGAVSDDSGYGVVGAVKASAPGDGAVFFREPAAADAILGGDRTFFTSSASGAVISDDLGHTFSLTMTRTASAIDFSLVFDGGAAITGSSSSNLITSFNQLTFSTGYETTIARFAIDDIVLDATNFVPVPEPSAAVLAGGGLLALLKRRRK